LYAFSYSITTTAVISDSLYDVIVHVFSGRYKTPELEHDREPDHDSRRAFWTQGNLNAVVGRNEYSDYSLLSWQFQNVPTPVNMNSQRK